MAENSRETARLFIAVNISDEVRERVRELQSELRPDAKETSVRWTPAENVHLTLKFIGAIERAAVAEIEVSLRRACTGAAPVELRAKGVGGFPNLNHPRVLWIGLGGGLNELSALHQRVLDETKPWGTPEERGFNPHLTIARVKDWRGGALRALTAKMKLLAAREFGDWTVGEVCLMRSETLPDGARHSCVATVRL